MDRDTCTPCPILKTTFGPSAGQRRTQGENYGRIKVAAYSLLANSQWLANLAERSPLVRASGGLRVITPESTQEGFSGRERRRSVVRGLGIQQSAFVIAAGAASLADAIKNIRWLLEQLTRLPELQDLVVLLAGERCSRYTGLDSMCG